MPLAKLPWPSRGGFGLASPNPTLEGKPVTWIVGAIQESHYRFKLLRPRVLASLTKVGMERNQGPRSVGPSQTEVGESAASLVSRLELADLEQKLDTVHRREKRHLLWMVLGLSPAAALPAVGLLLEGSSDLLLLLIVLVSVFHTVSWNKAAREAERMEKELDRLQAETDVGSEERPDRRALT